MTHKLLKKIVGNFGYKLVEKNFSKNERLISSKSFLKIEKLLENMFLEKKISNLIQIGANDGERFDLLNSFIKKHQCKSLLVEPIKENFDKLKNNYKNESNVILELKYNYDADKNADQITNLFPFRLSKNSKYIEGVNICHY